MTPVERTVLLGVPLARLDMEDTVAWVDQAIASGEPHQIATANMNFLAHARRNPEFLRILQDASLVTADGMPLCWASRLQGAPIPARVTGADLVPRLCALAADRGYRVFLMGPPGSTGEAARRLTERYPGLRIVGVETPPFGPIESWDNAAYCARIRQARADLLLVGFGAPKQERWIARYLPRTEAAVAIGVGATFDYIAGRVRRAPWLFQAVGLEWAWRIWEEPRRLWRRYLVDGLTAGPAVLNQLVTSHLAERRSRRARPGRVQLRRMRGRGEVFVLSLSGRFPTDRLDVVQRGMRGVRGTPLALVLDLVGARFLAPAVLGELVALVGWVRSTGGSPALVVSAEAARQLAAAGLDSLAPRFPTVAEAVGHLMRDRERRLVVAA
ncbi:MAG TPA: WecB/TagA/CpsF family glycosyltransferase [Methylomirabilota bacterium]|jgi:N-acetylglucosaminyldiphosphoundecaprenol N-acetyl-beta-D-mannosaminyltransferase|nr:WecB/TagA/CpsF family glycosyltransferase [Methylomirabilota bacterium]